MKTTIFDTTKFAVRTYREFVGTTQKGSGLLKIALIALMLSLSGSNAFGQIALRGTAQTSSTTTTTLTVAKPTGLAVNDLLIANIVQSNGSSNAMGNATRTGWTVVASGLYASTGTSRWHMTVLYKVADATDVAAANYAFTLNASSDDGVGGVVALSGVNTANPIDVLATTNTGQSNSITATGLTSVTDNAAIMMFTGLADDVNVGTWTATSPASLAELFDEEFNATADMSAGAAWALKPTAGATGNGAGSLGATERWGAVLLAIRPVTITTSAVSGSPFCAGNSVSVPYTIAGPYNAGNVFTAQLSNASGSFASPVNIGSVTSTSAGTISATIPAGQATGTGYRIRVVSSSPVANGSNNGTNIAINGAATAVAGTAVTTCNNSGPVNITAGSSATNMSSVLWTSSGTGSFTNANSLTLATYTPSAADIASGSVTLTLTSNPVAPCVATAASNKTLSIIAAPTASAGGTQTICQTQTATVSGASAANGTIAWTENGAGSITSGVNTLTPTYTPAAGDAGNTVTLTMTVTNSPCSAATATYTVHVTASPTAAAGTNVSTCSDAGSVNITAGATASNNSSVLWTSSGTGTFTNNNSLTLASYSPSAADIAAGNVTITLTAIANSPCSNATSSKTLTIKLPPTATAGGSQTICQNQTVTVSGATSSNGTIAWTENGAGSITAGANTLTPTYTAAAGDAGNTVTLTMTVSNAPCAAATATYTVQVLALPTASAGPAVSTCSNSGAVTIGTGATASNTDGVLWSTSGTGTFIDGDQLNNAQYVPSAADIAAGTVTLTLTASGNGSCNSATSTKALTINEIPQTLDAVICQGGSGSLLVAAACRPTAPANSGPLFPSSGVNSGTGTAWGSPGNIFSNNNANATVQGQQGSNVTSQALNATGFGFAVPANATIVGVQASIGRLRSGSAISGEARDNSLKLIKGGSVVGNSKAATGTNWPTSETAANYGSATDLWGTSLTVADVNAANFGLSLVVDVTAGGFGSRVANVDYVQLTVTYTLPGSVNWYTASSGGTLLGSGSSFNPVGVAGSGLADTNTPGVTTYYAECSTVPGCRTPTNFVINALPTVNFGGLSATPYCQDAAAVTLVGNHSAGSFSGNGITNTGNGTATFSPAAAGVGAHVITYSYTDGNTCTQTYSLTANVNANVVYYADVDGDGFGNLSAPQTSCLGAPTGYVTNSTDCNDADNTKNAEFSFYVDGDLDGFGTGSLVSVCAVDAATAPAGYSVNDTDCNDADNTKNAVFGFYADADGDTFGAGSLVNVCAVNAATPPTGYSVNDTDCDDADNTKHATYTFYEDIDGDGYGAGSAVSQCAVNASTPPAGYSLNSLDCDDTKSLVYPGAVEIGYNLIDDDCDGSVDEGFPPKVTIVQGCNYTLPAIDSYVYANIVGGAQGYRWRVTAMSGPNSGQVQFLNTPLRAMRLTQLGTYAFGTTYKIEVAVYYAGFLQPFTETNCTVSTPATITQLVSCGQSLNSMNDVVYCNSVPFTAGYRFRISDPLNPLVFQVLDRSLREFRMSLVNGFAVQYGKTYSIEVALKNTDGTYLPYGPACTVTTPLYPTTSLEDDQCNDYSVPSIHTQIFAHSYPGAIAYVFNLTGPGLPGAGVEVVKVLRAFKLSDFTGLIPGATYNVKVRMVFNAGDAPGPYGKTCTIVVPAIARTNDFVKAEFSAVAYPNPFADNFSIDLKTSAETSVNVKVYDMTGRLLESHNVSVAGMQSLTVGNRYPSGVYNVIVTQGENVRTLRVIKR